MSLIGAVETATLEHAGKIQSLTAHTTARQIIRVTFRHPHISKAYIKLAPDADITRASGKRQNQSANIFSPSSTVCLSHKALAAASLVLLVP